MPIIQPVSDPKLQVTDAKILTQLAVMGIDKDFVEFSDYSGARPYGKLYTDLKSDKRILVSSGLPMARKSDGTRLTPGFELSGGVYWLKNNLFDGYALGNGEFHLACVNDQPTGPIAGDESHFAPVLYIGKEAVYPKAVSLLETDPTNENYHDNVLEWDYGICKRRIRVIEGRFRGSWIFDQNPGADVRIEYNRTGKLNLKYGKARDAEGNDFEIQVPVNDVEFIPASAWDGRTGPITVGDTGTFYPDADPETATVDGHVYRIDANQSWATLRGGTGNGHDDTSVMCGIVWEDAPTVGTFSSIFRSIFLFDTSAIPDTATVSSSTFSLWVQQRNYAGRTFGVTLVGSSPASNTDLVQGDFAQVGSTAYSDAVPTSSLAEGNYRDFSQNATGIAAIDKQGISKLGLRLAGDISNTDPGWWSTYYQSGIFGITADYGEGRKPKLVITYSTQMFAPLAMNHYRHLRG